MNMIPLSVQSSHSIILLLGMLFFHVAEASPESLENTIHQEPPFYSKAEKNRFITVGRYSGIDENKAVDISNISLGKTYYVTDGIGLSGEILAILARGKRDTIDANAEGIGGFFALRWHFIRGDKWSLFLNQGIGPVLFMEEFPPGGTKLNALIQYSLGVSAQLREATVLQLGIRHIHISNGKGMVDNNPAYDGRGLYFDITQQL